MAKIYIGIGHGGSDSGAVANGFEEADLNLSIGRACVAELRHHGVDVLVSRTVDLTESLSTKIKECNAFKPDLCADIHINAGGGDGAEIFHTLSGGKGKTLGQNILEEIKLLGQNSRGLKTRARSDGKDYYGFIRETIAPAVIIECAFIDNKKDLSAIDTEGERKAFGKAIAKGFLKSLGIAYQPEKAEAKEAAYKDAAEIPAWAKEAVAYVSQKGYMEGSGGYFRPDQPITRAEIAVILHRLK